MPNVNLTSPLDAQQEALNRKRALAQALQQMSMQPLQAPPVAGARISPVEGIAKLVQALSGNLENRKLDKQQAALSSQQQASKLAQALSLSRSVVPPAQGDTLQGAASMIPGLEEQGPTLPPAPQQLDAQNETVKALAAALSSSDPNMQEAGKAIMQNFLTGSREQKTQAAEMARLLSGQKFQDVQNQNAQYGENQRQASAQTFTGGQNTLNRNLTAAEGAADRQSRMDLATLKPPPNTPQPTSAIQEYQFYKDQETQSGKTPLSFDDWQNRDANRKKTNPNAATVVIQTEDAQGNKVTRIVPKVAGAEYTSAPTAQEQNRRDQAAIVSTQVDHVISLIDKTPGAVGPILGRLAKGETVIGTVSPEAKALATALGSLEALQPILHGYRGGSQTMEHFHSIIGDQNLNAAALKASLNEIKQLAEDIRGADKPAANSGGGLNLPDDIRQKLMNK